MKKRYITFYKFRLKPLPHFKSYGMLSTDKWLSCLGFGISKMVKGEISFFTIETPKEKEKISYR